MAASDRPKTPCRLSISKVSVGGSIGGDYINLTLTDVSSGIQFVDIEMSFKTFGEIVSGGSYTKVDAELRGLEDVGKKFVHEKRSIDCPLTSAYPREPLEEWLLENGKEDGWIINPCLGSQGSITRKPNLPGMTLHYQVFKYV